MYWLQPSMPLRYLDFWLPTAALALTVWVWASVRGGPPAEGPPTEGPPVEGGKTGWGSILILLGTVMFVAVLRYVEPVCCLTPTRPPQIAIVIAALGGVVGIGWALGKGKTVWVVNGISVLLIVILIVLKTPALAQAASAGVRALSGQNVDLATPFDLRWLGFSYLAFRLVHVLRDAATGRVPQLALDEFVLYATFFPAYTAGPIDRVQRFVGDVRAPARGGENLLPAGTRIAVGVFKKFVLADGLALIALSETNAGQVLSSGWAWGLLYAYALRIYFDFSGYTDLAIGIGRLAGVKLPENFDAPYGKPNLTAFWNSWHMTLAQWFRAYYFNPLTRALRGRALWGRKVPIPAVIFLTQVTTMILIGLWHGVTWNFLVWGAWHGVGLFVHNRWNEAFRARYAQWEGSPRLKRVFGGAGTLLTFHFVTLGWVWFALGQPRVAWAFFTKLLGG